MATVATVAVLASSVTAGGPKGETPTAKPKPKPKPAPPSEPPPPERFERDMVLRMHMHESFDLVRAIERLLIRGKLEDAARLATAISEVPDAPAHGPWAAQSVLVRDRAAAVARATTVDQACQAEAKLAAACGGCHIESKVAPEFRQYPPAPADNGTIPGRMLRHRWAADRLWEGIIGGADEPWQAGLDVLAAAPLDWGDGNKERETLARDLQRLASTARKQKTESLDTRATAYGEMLSTCAACHTLKPTQPAAPKK